MTQSTRNALVSAYKETKNLRKTIYGIILKAQQRMCTLKKPQDGTFSFNLKRTLKKPVTGKIWDHQFPAWSHRDTGNHFLKNERLSVSGCFWVFFLFFLLQWPCTDFFLKSTITHIHIHMCLSGLSRLSTRKKTRWEYYGCQRGCSSGACITCGMHVLRSVRVFWSSLDFHWTSLRPDTEILSCVPCLVPLTRA